MAPWSYKLELCVDDADFCLLKRVVSRTNRVIRQWAAKKEEDRLTQFRGEFFHFPSHNASSLRSVLANIFALRTFRVDVKVSNKTG